MVEIDTTRAVVDTDETHDGRIIPTRQAEIDRSVRIYDGATVTDGVYGSTVVVEGGTVEGSIMASDGVELDDGRVDGEVGTPGKVTGSDTTVYGTVTGKRIRLSDTIVFGNVVGKDVILEDCLVVGITTAERKLTLEQSLCYTFKTHGETTLDGATIVLPQAILDGTVAFESPVAVTGLGELETVEDDLPEMDESNLIDVDGDTYLSLTPQILNLEAVSARLEELEETISSITSTTRGEERPEPESVLEVLGVAESRYPDPV